MEREEIGLEVLKSNSEEAPPDVKGRCGESVKDATPDAKGNSYVEDATLDVEGSHSRDKRSVEEIFEETTTNEPIELTHVDGFHLGHVVDGIQSKSSTPVELPKGLVANPIYPITTHTTNSTILITWCLPNYDQGTMFQVEMKLCTAIGWTLVYYGRATSFTMTELPSGTDIGLRVRSVNLDKSGWSCEALCSTLPGPPGPPSALAALNIGSSKVELGWRPPVHDGGSDISGFHLQINKLQQSGDASATADAQNGQQKFVTIFSGNNFVVEGLEPGATYCCQVQAFNMLGDGPYSELIVLETQPAPPAIPESPVIVETTCKSVSLSWPFPLCNGAPVESFELQMLDLGYGEKYIPACDDSNSATHYDVYSGPSNDFTMKKLEPFSSYAFRVKAQNVAGFSEFSAFSACMTSPASPHPPPLPTVVETMSSSLTLKWEMPKHDNGSPVFGYTLEMLKVELTPLTVNGGKKLRKTKLGKQDAAVQVTTRVWEVVYDGHGLGSQIAGLAPGNEYRFRVKAHNALGASSPSSTLVAKTLPAAPGAPQPPNFIKVTPTSVQIKWSSPARDNGMPVTSYKLLIDDGQGGQLRKVYEGEAKLYNTSKLVPSSSYRVAVQAVNACGASDVSEVAVVELPDELPEAPPPTPATATVEVELPYKERPAPAMAAVASPKKERPALAMVAVASSKKERPALAMVAVASSKKERPAPIKSKKEVKELIRQKAHRSWSQKVTKLIVPNTWQIQQPWPLWEKHWMYVGAVFVMLLLLKMLYQQLLCT